MSGRCWRGGRAGIIEEPGREQHWPVESPSLSLLYCISLHTISAILFYSLHLCGQCSCSNPAWSEALQFLSMFAPVYNAYGWKPSSHQPGWLEQM